MGSMDLQLATTLGSDADGLTAVQKAAAHFQDGAVDGAFWDISDPSKNNVAIDGTGSSVTDGALLGRRLDISGNNRHLSAPADGNRPSWDLVGGVPWATFSAADEHQGALFAGTYRVYAALQPDAASAVTFTDDSSTHFVGTMESGSASQSNNLSGSPVNYVDNSALSDQTRGVLYTALTDASPHILHIESVDFTTATPDWLQFNIGGYGGAFDYTGKIGSVIVFPEASITSEIHTDFYNALASQIGATLLTAVFMFWGNLAGDSTLWGNLLGNSHTWGNLA